MIPPQVLHVEVQIFGQEFKILKDLSVKKAFFLFHCVRTTPLFFPTVCSVQVVRPTDLYNIQIHYLLLSAQFLISGNLVTLICQKQHVWCSQTQSVRNAGEKKI